MITGLVIWSLALVIWTAVNTAIDWIITKRYNETAQVHNAIWQHVKYIENLYEATRRFLPGLPPGRSKDEEPS